MVRRLIAIGYALGLAGPVAFLCRCSASPPEERVVFFGASITEDYRLKGYFPGKPYLNRGQGGELAFQMLQRFDRDLVDLKPRAAVLKLCAINFGPKAPSLGVTKSEYGEMIDRALAAGIRPVLATVVPVSKEWADRKGARVQPEILAFNDWVRQQGRRRALVVADYHAAMAGPDGYVKPGLAADGLHPNAAGYAAMTRVVGPAIEQTLRNRRPLPRPAYPPRRP